MTGDTPAPALQRNTLFDAARAGTLFMQPMGHVSHKWGAPWKLIAPDWIVGPVGLILTKDIEIPAGEPGLIEGFDFSGRDRSSKVVWHVVIAPIIITGRSPMRLSRMVSVPEFLPAAKEG